MSAGIIREIDSSTSYRYLGVEQVFRVHSGLTRARVRQEYLKRVALVWSSPLSTSEKVAAHNRWAVAVVRFYMSLIVWYRRYLIELDVRTRARVSSSVGAGGETSPQSPQLPPPNSSTPSPKENIQIDEVILK